MDVRSALNQATRDLERAGNPSPRLDAEVLLAFCLGKERLDLYKYPDRTLDASRLLQFFKAVARRINGEPVAYITGYKEFWSFRLAVNSSVLIPRPETEIIVEEAINLCRLHGPVPIRLLDIGTGSGAIAIALAKEVPHAKLVATDITAAILALAGRNAANLGVGERIDFREGNLFEPVDDYFDIIVSNPPYIGADEYEKLPAGVKDFEPRTALLAGAQGTEYYERLAAEGVKYLKDKGWLLLEIGATQESAVSKIIKTTGGYEDIGFRVDYAGHPRVIRARKKA